MKAYRPSILLKKPQYTTLIVLCSIVTAGLLYRIDTPEHFFDTGPMSEQIAEAESHLADTTGMVMPDGSVYEGSILAENKLPHGYGVLAKDGTSYEGEWQLGELPYGKRRTDDWVYTGYFDDQLRNHGFGIIEYNRHYVEDRIKEGAAESSIFTRYAGNWQHDVKSGIGKANMADNTINFGHFRSGVYQPVKGAKFNVGDRIYGIDLSHHNRKIDWDNLALYCNDKGEVFHKGSGSKRYMQPVSFVYLKATEGATHRDTTYAKNALQAERHGIAKGAYHFLRLASPIDEQVQNFLETADWKPGDMPPVLDVELPNELRAHGTDGVFEWLEKVEQALGVRPIIYTGENIRDNYLAKDPRLNKYHCWIARYNPKGPKSDAWHIWQFSDKGRGNGHSGNIDINLFKGNHIDFNRYLKNV